MLELGNPHHAFQSIHVAGTNGKGSTANFIADLLQRSSLKVGLTTSPHLCSARERIRLNGSWIDERDFIHLEQRVHQASLKLSDRPTFFERVIAMAFCFFAREKVDVAVVEVGMGGRLDATNVLKPLVSVITPIALDHQQFLGTDLPAIAKEKCGIIKTAGRVLIGKQAPEAMEIIDETVFRLNAAHQRLGQDFRTETQGDRTFVLLRHQREPLPLQLRMHGKYQPDNFALAVAACEGAGFDLTDGQIKASAQAAHWPGRCDVLNEAPLWVADGAHNPAGARSLGATLGSTTGLERSKMDLGVGFCAGPRPRRMGPGLARRPGTYARFGGGAQHAPSPTDPRNCRWIGRGL